MNFVNKITEKEITRLESNEATELLLMLLTLESQRLGSALSGIHVPLNITVSDGGEDASVEWKTPPSITDWIPDKNTLFQIKAKPMSAEQCKKELVIYNKSSKRYSLKPRIEHIYNQQTGAYILFLTKQALTNKGIKPRERKIRDAIRLVKHRCKSGFDIRVYDANKISNWCNLFPQAVSFVYECLRLSKPLLLQTWKQWSEKREFARSFVTTKFLEERITEIREALSVEKISVRMLGLSGLGKTRIVLEAFRPPENDQNLDQKTRSDLVLYYDAAYPPSNLPDYVITLCESGARAILIVDNCDYDLNRRLAEEITRTKSHISLLTIDSNPDKILHSQPHIIIKAEQLRDLVPKILKQLSPPITDSDIQRIEEFSQGFPLIAVLLAQDRETKSITLGSLNDHTLVEKILGTGGDNDVRSVIRACSIFERLGYLDDLQTQMNYVACNELISGLDGSDKIKKSKFNAICMRYINRGVLDLKGRYISVKPKPLALRLAAEWWENCPRDEVVRILDELTGEGLATPLCDQMAKLDFLPHAREVTRQLCGNQGPFGKAEVLNSEEGSRLFRSLVEVNPQATLECIERVFGNWNREELLTIGSGRRHLVWALEKLCFWENTFSGAARLMLAFASAENESWGNNATNQFIQLFQTFLSGTQANPLNRLQILDEALAQSDPERHILAVKSLGRAIQTHGLSRMGGVEQQGSKMPQSEWRPKIWKDAFDYWKGALERLTTIASVDNQLGANARLEVTKGIRGLVQYGRMDDLDNSIRQITKTIGAFWPEALESVQDTIRYDSPNISEDGRNKLHEWITLLTPTDFTNRLRLTISIPSWSHFKDVDGHYVDVAEVEASKLGSDCGKNPELLIQNLNILLQGEQRKAIPFGMAIGETITDAASFIDLTLSTLQKIPVDKANSDLLAGFLRTIRHRYPDLATKTLETVSLDELLVSHAVNLTRWSIPSIQDMLRIINLVRNRKIPISQLRTFSYGRVLDHLSVDEALQLSDEILSLEPDGVIYALDILYMNTTGEKEKVRACASQMRKILIIPGLLTKMQTNSHDSYRWMEIAKDFLQIKDDRELALALTRDIIEVCSQDNYIFNLEYSIGPVVQILLEKYMELTWPFFAESLLSDNWRLKHNVGSLLEPNERMGEIKPGLLSLIPDSFLQEWMRMNSVKAPVLLSRIIHLFEQDEETFKWNSIAMFIFDEFGYREDVLSSVGLNIFSFGWIGSAVPHYEQRIKGLTLLEHHSRPEVRKWAANLIRDLEEEIRKEKKRNEEFH